MIFSIIAALFLSGCNLFGTAGSNSPARQRQSPRRQAAEKANAGDAEALFQRLDEKFKRLVALRDQIENDRVQEEVALSKEFADLRQLREEMQRWLDTRKTAAAPPPGAILRRKSSADSGANPAGPEESRYLSSLDELDNNKKNSLQPLAVKRKSQPLAAPAPKGSSLAPPPFAKPGGKAYSPPATREEKVTSLLPDNEGISPPPFAVSARPRVKAPAKPAPQPVPAKPEYFSRAPRPPATPESSLHVIEVREAPLGRILNVEGKGGNQRILLDIGSSDGLFVGSLVSVGGIGAEYGIWQVESVKKYSCRARHLPGSANRTPTTGTYVHVVRLESSK